jgi:sugar lactone lactonase YvrE
MPAQVSAQTITTVVGTGEVGFSGDGGPAVGAFLSGPARVAVDGSGNLFIADELNQRVRRVVLATGIITTVAGTGEVGFSGDGSLATTPRFNRPRGLAVDGRANLYIADTFNHRVRKVVLGAGTVTTVAGSGLVGFSGDGGPAVQAELASPDGVAVDASGNLFIADTLNGRVRKVDGTAGIITTVAGTGAAGFAGDGGPATRGELNAPSAVAVDDRGNLFIADLGNHRIRKVDGATGIITTVAGTGAAGFAGDGGLAVRAGLNFPLGVAVDGCGNLLIADTNNERIRQIDLRSGIITTVGGRGVFGFAGDGGPATDAQLHSPSGLAVDTSGNVFLADQLNQRVRTFALPGAGARPTMTAPADGSRYRLAPAAGAPVAFAWTALPGAAQYGFEYSAPGQRFTNPNGVGPDSVHGFGGSGGGFLVTGTGFTTSLAPAVPRGAYQVRVVGLSAAVRVIGCFSDAVTVVVE